MKDADDRGATGRDSYFVEFKAGDVVFQEGDASRAMYIVESGEVDILRRIGSEERLLATLESGEFFGEMSLLEALPRVASARTRSDCRLLEIEPEVFQTLIRSRPEVVMQMLRKLSERLRELSDIEAHTPELPADVADLSDGAEAAPDDETVAREGAEGGEPSIVLVHASSDTRFDLPPGDGEVTVGRADTVTGHLPHVDLGPIDAWTTVSRRHAKIMRRGDRFFVMEETRSANGTWVGEDRLIAGAVREATLGDTLRFGGVRLLLRSGEASS
ncbi:MAG: cyclic nucleotide-binding domain-containing protein [Acidobacteriota bacterium]